ADVILHVGDYFYRESPCPEGNKGCEGSPSGYNWDAWNADWFSPANTMLRSSVMVFSRGNHEDCNRAHNGWFRYLSPWAYKEAVQNCTAMENPYMIKLEDVTYIMFDSSYGKDSSTSEAQLALYKKAIKQLQFDKHSTYALLTHRAVWTYNKVKSKYYYGNLTQQIAFKNLLPNNTLFISGHAHYLQALDMQTDYDQIIIGNGGSKLYSVDNNTQKLVDINKHMANFVYSRSGFGYGILSHADKTFKFYDQVGADTGSCSWLLNKQHSTLSCQ
ncbi:MAG: metallophosphoesterase, partial [Gammaproteobacteria bacterium]|nr:metallophosphoesterase [Gammaproteobacteria bacterium]